MRSSILRAGRGCALALGMVSAAVVTPTAAQTRRALLIGIDQYVVVAAGQPSAEAPPASPGQGRALITNLDGALNDAEAMRELLVARFQFRPDNIRLLRNGEATRAGILAAIQRLVEESRAGDAVFFFYAGHGSQRRNSLSAEPSKLDQTIVPADANSGVFDIRDKELARSFNPLMDKGVTLTLIFDSCHSGSIVRGVPVAQKIRWAGFDDRDAADSYNPPRPEDRGALVISSAQDYQPAAETVDDDGSYHGVFTNALLKTLRSVPSDEPAIQVFQSVKAIMQSEGRLQEPVLAGPLDRRKLALFGGAPGSAGRTTVALLRVRDSNSVELQGGIALGIRAGAELTQLAPPEAAQPVRLRVSATTGLSRSTARVLAGSTRALTPGAQFVIESWVAPGGDALRVWLPPATLSAAALRTLSAELAGLRGSGRIEWVDEPAAPSASGAALYTLLLGATGWELRPPSGRPVSLGATVSAQRVAAAIAQQTGGPARLFVLLPPSVELRRHLRVGQGTPHNAIQPTPVMADAQYLLVGRIAQSGPEYAWVLPNATQDLLQSSALPVRSDWVASSGRDSLAGAQLEQYSLRIAKLRAWLRLESPPDDGRFPYRLALKNVRTGALVTEGQVRGGEDYGLVLHTDPARINPTRLERRRVYVFAIDSHGTGVLLFPASDVQNRVPQDQRDGSYPAEIQLGDSLLFSITAPFGVDTYFLLSSDEAISTDALAWEGVRTRGPGVSPLSALLSNTGAATRAPEPKVPAHWSIQRLTVKSVP